MYRHAQKCNKVYLYIYNPTALDGLKKFHNMPSANTLNRIERVWVEVDKNITSEYHCLLNNKIYNNISMCIMYN